MAETKTKLTDFQKIVKVWVVGVVVLFISVLAVIVLDLIFGYLIVVVVVFFVVLGVVFATSNTPESNG